MKSVAEVRLQDELRGLLESAPDAMVIVDAHGEIVLVNAQTEAMFGYGREELLGKPVEILVPDRFRGGHERYRGDYSEDPHPRPMGVGRELFGRRKDGSEFPVEISLGPLQTDEGILISSAIRDITERKRSEEKFRGLLESAPDAMVIVDAHGEIVLVNAQTEALFGYGREELVGKSVEILVPDRFRDGHRDFRDTYSGNPHLRPMGVGRELFGRRKDGSEFPVEISLGPLQTEDGVLISSAIRDITERKRSEEESAHFKAVVESSRDAIISKDLNGVITSWNAGAEQLYGYSAAESIGKSMSMLVAPGHEDELSDLLGRVRSGEQIDNYETIRERKDGSQVEVSLTVSPMRDRFGTIFGASTIARDISEILRYQEQLRRLAEHDPLTGLRNRRRFDRDVTEQVGRARRYGEQATLLIIDLNGFKRINDTFGHRNGDRVLKAVALALKARLRDTDVVARLGGDEFAVLLPYSSADQGTIIAEDLRRAIDECTVEVDGYAQVQVTASVGIVQIDNGTASYEEVLAEADRLMYEDKRMTYPQTARLDPPTEAFVVRFGPDGQKIYGP